MSAVNDIAKKLTDEESQGITALHRQAQELVHAIGQTEVRKAKLLSQLSDVEERAQGIMNSVGARLGLPQGVPWQVTPDGQVILIDPKTGQPLPAQE
jgi:phage gp29-like protein